MADAPRTGLVTGTVLGPDGQAQAGVTVRLEGSRGVESAVTADDGRFRFVFVVPDAYTVRADLEGFQPAEGQIVVSAGGRAEVELRLGEVLGEEIVVVAETPLVNRYDVTAGGTVTNQEVAAMVAEGRNFTQVVSFMPGVTNNFQSQRYYNFQPEVEGTGAGRSAFYLDGVDVSFARVGGASRLQFPSFALQEIKLESSGIGAEFSRVVGGVTSMTLRSGSNDFHGSATYYAQNQAWNESSDVVPVPQPDEIKHSYEIALGGPIVRDKLWFMVAYGDREDPGQEVLYDGKTPIDAGITYESPVAKVDWRPAPAHSISAAWVETPIRVNQYNARTADTYTAAVQELAADFLHAGWNWAISDNLLLDTHVALQSSWQTREPYEVGPIDPACTTSQPCGNHLVYTDIAAPGLPQYNGVAISLGVGEVDWPRDQVNLSLDWFKGVHDVKVGVDYQDVGYESTGTTTPEHFGRGYDRHGPGGFQGNLSPNPAQRGYLRVYLGPAPGEVSESNSEILGLFVRDRISLDRWTFNLGLRLDQQKHTTDAGVVTSDSTDVVPRVTAVYDISGDSKLLASATVGRYTYVVNMNYTAQFNETPGGKTYYRQYAWNPATQAYDILTGSVLPSQQSEVTPVDPYYKDEYTLGLDWSFHPDWVLKTKLLYWQMKDFHTNYLQYTEDGTAVRYAQQNDPDFESTREAIHLSVQRRFRDGWTVSAAYVYSNTEISTEQGTACDEQDGELLDIVDQATGIPLSRLNREGKLTTDHTHQFKLRGSYQLQLGHGHSLNLGASFWTNSGEPWTRGVLEQYQLPGGIREQVWRFQQPRGSYRIPTQKQLNLNLDWNFPLVKQVAGQLRVEVSNATNEQELVGTLGLMQTGVPQPTSLNYQRPRYYRLMASLTF
jgi:hypothetical protein